MRPDALTRYTRSVKDNGLGKCKQYQVETPHQERNPSGTTCGEIGCQVSQRIKKSRRVAYIEESLHAESIDRLSKMRELGLLTVSRQPSGIGRTRKSFSV